MAFNETVYEYIDDMPDLQHWKPVMEFTVEQASLLLAGLDPFDVGTLAEAKSQQFPRWKNALAHSLAIVSAIRQGLISPVVCCAWVLDNDYGWGAVQIKPSDRFQEISPAHTIITRASLVNWIAIEKVQFTRPRPQQVAPTSARQPPVPITIEDKPETLTLSYHGHKSEGLEFVADAIKQLWSTYDPDDPNTAPTRDVVVDYLRSKGAGANMADAVNLILRPRNLRKTGLKNNKVPTRES